MEQTEICPVPGSPMALAQKVASICGVDTSIGKEALEHTNWDYDAAVTIIKQKLQSQI